MYVATDRLYNVPLAFLTRWSKKKVVFAIQRRIPRDSLVLVKELMEEGRYRAVVDRTYLLEEAGEAASYVDSWQKIGNVILTLNGGPAR